MSDTSGAPPATPGTPAAPATPVTPATPAASPAAPASPAASGQQRLSVTEAAQLLSGRRRSAQAGQDGAAGDQQPAPRRRQQRDAAVQTPATAATPAMRRSVATPGGESTPAAGAKPNGAAAPGDGGDVFSNLAKVLGPPGAAATPPGDGATAAPAPGTPAPGTPAADGATMTLEIEGKPQAFTAAQLRQAVLQANDYTKKTQDLAAFHRQLEDQRAALATVLPLIQPEIDRLQKAMQGVQRPDVALLETDPARYHREHALWEQARDEQQRLGELATMQQQQAERELAQRVEQGHKVLAQKLPFWNDAKQRTAVQQALAEWGLKEGFSRDELRQLADPRHLIVMTKAMMWDRMAGATRTTAPVSDIPARGTAPPPPPAQEVSAAEQQFTQKPNARSGAALLSARRRANTRMN